jgi:hypothetical protein
MRTGAVEAAYLALEWSDLALPYPLQRCPSVAVEHLVMPPAHLVALDPPI